MPRSRSETWGMTQGDPAHTGTLDHHFSTEPPTPIQLGAVAGPFTSAPLLSGNRALVTRAGEGPYSEVVCFDWLRDEICWSHSIQAIQACFWSSGIVSGEDFLAFDYEFIRVIDLSSGKVTREMECEGSQVSTSPAIAVEGCLYRSTLLGAVSSLSRDLKFLWASSAPAGVIYSPPAAMGKVLAFQSLSLDSGAVTLVGLDNGDVIWQRTDLWPARGVLSMASGRVVRQALHADGTSQLMALNLKTGLTEWTTEARGEQRDQSLQEGVAITQDIVLACVSPSAIEARELSTGQLMWRKPLSDRCFVAPVACTNLVFVACEMGTVEAFEVESGSRVWSFDLRDRIELTPALSSGGLLVTSENSAWRLGLERV